jgi:hypothetical protein
MRSDIADWLGSQTDPVWAPSVVAGSSLTLGRSAQPLSAYSSALRPIPQVGPEVARSIGMASLDWVATQLEACEKHSVNVITFEIATILRHC